MSDSRQARIMTHNCKEHNIKHCISNNKNKYFLRAQKNNNLVTPPQNKTLSYTQKRSNKNNINELHERTHDMAIMRNCVVRTNMKDQPKHTK